MRRRWILASLLPVFLTTATADRRREATLRLITRDYKGAVALLQQDVAEREGDAETRKTADRALFLLAQARLLSGDRATARQDFARLERDYPQSVYRYLARFGRARCLRLDRSFEEAAGIYEREVTRLLSPKRRVGLAGTYLELVEKRLRKEPPDRKNAMRFLDLAVGLGLPSEKALELRRRAARIAFDAQDWKNAGKRYEQVVKLDRGASVWEDRLWLARAWRRSGRVPAARRLLEDLLRAHVPAERGPIALLELAHCFGVPDDKRLARRGIDVLERFLAKYPTVEQAPEAAYLLARTQATLGRAADALASFDAILDRFGDRDAKLLARVAADKAGMLQRLDRFDEATAAWKAYLSGYPAHGRWMEAQRAIVDIELAKADARRAAGKEHDGEARKLYEAFLREHPLDARTRRIYLTLGEMSAKRDDFAAAKSMYERAVSKFPRTREASEAAFRIGRLLETKLFDYKSALAAYRKVQGPFQGQARARLRVLEKKSLALRTERVFLTKEKARVEVVSRNIQSLRVRVYKLDMRTFFRGTLGRGKVDSLAVEVISPDKSFDSKIDDYTAHKETKRSILIPFDGAGAYVVKVDDQEFEATTLVLVSDLAVITKSSRQELFVFAQNTLKNAPQVGAKVFVTDGKTVVAEGVTDARGSYRLRTKKLANAARLHVFATTESGSAASTLELAGLKIAQGLTAKAFLYTDRSVYKPGEVCAVKAVVRDARDGRYVLPATKQHRIELLDAAGRVLTSTAVDSSDVGTVATRFLIPAEANPGKFSLRLRRGSDGRVLATHRFPVAQFTAPRVSLTLVSEHRVLPRGGKIEGRVRARYFFGGPVVGKKVEVTAPIGVQRILRGTTDAAGEFPFSFETAALDAGSVVDVRASLPAERAQATQRYWVTDTGYDLSVSLPSSVYLAGDDLEAVVVAKGHDGKPIARTLQVSLLRLETKNGSVHEVPVASKRLETDVKTGHGFARFELAVGGHHRVRVEGRDRFENRIEAHRDFFVSGKDDDVKLRILAVAQHGKVGGKLALRVVNRVGPRLCLVTTEGDGVLKFETRMFPLGESQLELALDELHAPNFAWALSMVDDRKLHQARKTFVVSKPLVVRVKPGTERMLPGGKLAIELETRDTRGQPVSAELSVAIVDKAIFDLYPDRSPGLYGVFFGPRVRRVTDLRTASSCTFSYDARTKRVNADLRAEENRARLEEAEDKARLQAAVSGDDFIMGRGDRRNAAPGREAAGSALPVTQAQKAWGSSLRAPSAGGFYRGPGDTMPGLAFGFAADNPARVVFGVQPAGQQILAFQNLSMVGNAPDIAATPVDPRLVLDTLPSIWRAVVRTDAQGHARLTLTAPRRPGAWHVRARGATADHLFGEASTDFVTAKDLIARPNIPLTLTEGDQPRALVSLHNLSERQARVSWSVEGAAAAHGALDVPGKSSREATFTFTAKTAGETSLKLVAKTSAGAEDVVDSKLVVQPWAVEERVSHSGILSGEENMRMTLPAGRTYRSRTMVIELGPDTADELLPLRPLVRQRWLSCANPSWTAPTNANRAALGLAALAMWSHIAKTRPDDAGTSARLRAQIESAIATLSVSASSGKLRWMGKHRASSVDDQGSLLAARLFVLARKRGFVVDDGVLARSRSRVATLQRDRRFDLAALAFLVAAEDGRGDFTRFNTLYRARQRLAMAARAQLALGAIAMRRPGLANDLLGRLADEVRRVVQPGANTRRKAGRRPDERRVAAVLWTLRALAASRTHRVLVDAGAQWVYRHRTAGGWSDGLVTALAVELLAPRKVQAVASSVTVEVNGRFRKVFDFKDRPGHRTVRLAGKDLDPGENRVVLRTSGHGSVVWSVSMRGVTKDLPRDLRSDRIQRQYYQARPTFDGGFIREGFSTVRKVKTWSNLAHEVRVGSAVRVSVRFWPRAKTRAVLGSYVLEEPLPAGALVLRSEISGRFDRVELHRGFLRFFLHESASNLAISYTLRGVVPGKYRILPTRVFSLADPGLAYYGVGASMVVLGPEDRATDTRRLTPDELYDRGTKLFDRLSRDDLVTNEAKRSAAEKWLEKLYTQYGGQLRDKPFREVGRRLLRISLAKQDSARTVRLFEQLKDRDESWVLEFADMFAVGKAYYKVGEFERALVVYDAICETAFLREVQIAGTLNSVGEFEASVAFMENLFEAFPGTPTVRHSIYTLAQALNQRARLVQKAGKVDPVLGTRVSLEARARRLCYEFLLRHPDDADAAEVLFTLASVALESERLDEGIEILERASKAFPDSTWLDDFLYLEGYAWFLKGEGDKALARLERVANGKFPIGGGKLGPSDSRWLALFLQGQIHHAAGRPKEALALYAKVEKRFADAREAADYFRKRRLALPEVSLVKPGADSKVKLSYRNLSAVDLTVYKVDLMRLYLMRKSLSDMGNVQLFGIAPVHQERIELATGTDYRDHVRDIAIPAKGAGAYLVLVSSGELKSSGLMLRTDLDIDAQELVVEARIRVNVKRNGIFLPKAIVKVVGDRDGKIRTGRTDLRGVYVADGLRGRATVLVKVGESYAFHRGKVAFNPGPGGPTTPGPGGPTTGGGAPKKVLFDALKSNRLRNFKLQDARNQELQRLYKNVQRGVEIRRAK